MDENQAETCSALTQTEMTRWRVLAIVRGCSRIVVDASIPERALDDPGELAGCRGDRFRLAHPVGEAAIACPERGAGAAEPHGRHAHDTGVRLAEGCVLELRRRPPEILFCLSPAALRVRT
jgi:hypothetical protein